MWETTRVAELPELGLLRKEKKKRKKRRRGQAQQTYYYSDDIATIVLSNNHEYGVVLPSSRGLCPTCLIKVGFRDPACIFPLRIPGTRLGGAPPKLDGRKGCPWIRTCGDRGRHPRAGLLGCTSSYAQGLPGPEPCDTASGVVAVVVVVR